MAAMFQAQSANWEETQEKMSQLVSPICGSLVLVVVLSSNELRFSPLPSPFVYAVLYSAVRVYTNPRGGGSAGRGTQPRPHHQSDRPLPPSYVCYRCGQKGSLPFLVSSCRLSQPHEGHWIQDCPTNNDREFDNRPRIKRTTGIPRSFLKAVESPVASQLGHGVMVTPEGGYVVAQPDS